MTTRNNEIEQTTHNSPERDLWQAVVARAFQDASRKVFNTMTNEQDTKMARSWLLRGGWDFREVCELADFDPDFIQKMARAAKVEGWPRLSFVIHANGREDFE